MRIRLSTLSSVLSLGVLACASVHAQDFRAHVQGMVTDSSKAAVAGAAVSLVNVKTGVRTGRLTNEAGLYRFDYVDPGTYTITIELAGFSRFTQENFEIQAQGDITVDAVLNPGAVQETVNVTGSPVEVKFNTTNVALTVDTKLADELPRFDRNPFKLSLLLPNAVETRRNEMNPYNSWAPNSMELGGATDKKNDLMVDGSPVGIGYKTAWVPNTDAVQEANIQQNAVDAESGHSAGGTISMTTKAGTNDLHGSVFWLGRNPALNAVTDRTTGTFVAARNNIYGGSAGDRIIRNKLFFFVSYEGQQPRTPGTTLWSAAATSPRP
jgi:hypothetical protein